MPAGRPRKYATSEEAKAAKQSLRKAAQTQAESRPFKRSSPIFIPYEPELPGDIPKPTPECTGIRGLRVRSTARTLNNLSVPTEPRIEWDPLPDFSEERELSEEEQRAQREEQEVLREENNIWNERVSDQQIRGGQIAKSTEADTQYPAATLIQGQVSLLSSPREQTPTTRSSPQSLSSSSKKRKISFPH